MKEINTCIISSEPDRLIKCVFEDNLFKYSDCICAESLVLSGYPVECCPHYGEYKPPDFKERFLKFIKENGGDREFLEFIEFVMK